MTALLVGRFQPFHRGHLAVISDLRRSHPDASLLLVIGSAQESFTTENPFTAGERVEMVQRALSEARLDRCLPIPVTDIHQHAQWVAYLRGLLPPFDVVYTNNPLTRLLFERERVRVESPPLVERERFQGAIVRRRIAQGQPWQELVPPAVTKYLEEIGAVERLRRIAERDASSTTT
ncbi:MAG: nicotinamide-nucleotide adenylyltransferase [Thermoplasmata archaeon]